MTRQRRDNPAQGILSDFIPLPYKGIRNSENSTSGYNQVARELWAELGDRIPADCREHILKVVRKARGGKQGKGEVRTEIRLLLAIRQGLNWQMGNSGQLKWKVPASSGGRHEASNMFLKL